jgi:hypothetical protein
MAKKTFEITHKVSITSIDLREQFFWSLPHTYVDNKLWNKFVKVYDWDAILNSNKFSKHVNACMKDGTIYSDVICESYFDDNDSEFEKVKRAYDKFADQNKKVEKTLTQEYRVVLVGTEKEIHNTLELIDNSTCAESVDLL